MSSLRGASPALVKRLVLVAALVVLVLAMVLNTKFLTPSEATALKPAAFNAKTYVQKNFPKITETLTSKATDVVVLVPAITKDEAAAGKQYGVDVGSGKFAFPVKATGTVTEVDAELHDAGGARGAGQQVRARPARGGRQRHPGARRDRRHDVQRLHRARRTSSPWPTSSR